MVSILWNHIVLENPNVPEPPKPVLKDPTCGYITKYEWLKEHLLTHTIQVNESGIFCDSKTDQIIAIVIRNLARDYFDIIICPWSVRLIEECVTCCLLSRRNNPGKLAFVGISTCPRQSRLFGWV